MEQDQLMDRTFVRADMTSVYTGSKQIYYLYNSQTGEMKNQMGVHEINSLIQALTG